MRKRIFFGSLVALWTVAGCDWFDVSDYRAERADKHYRVAMADYTAGRIADAMKGFERAIASDPGNASARFQLACLLQDAQQDYLGAILQYREYLRLEPKSDKVDLAKKRLALCEKLLEQRYVDKATAGDALVQGVRATYEAQINQLKDELDKTLAENDNLRKDVARYRRFQDKLKAAEAGEEASESSLSQVSPRDLLDEDDGSTLAITDDIRELNRLAEEEDSRPSSSYLPEKKDTVKVPSLTQKENKPKDGVERPKTYIVQEGDTLYKIAAKFYDKASAWKRIREANKATVSTDGRIKPGQVIVLP